jgi:hypothetical protein
LVFTLVASLMVSSAAFAGESLAQSGARIVEAQASASSIAASGSAAIAGRASAGKQAPMFQQGQPVLSKSGLKRRTKAMIFIGLGIGFAASAYVIDHNVLDVTPSSLGTRQDK